MESPTPPVVESLDTPLETDKAAEEAKAKKKADLRRLRRWEWVGLTILALIVLAFGANFKPVTVLGDSMEPTLHSGQNVWVWRLAYLFQPLQPGDIIVFRADDGEELIKRIAFVQNPQGTARFPDRIPTIYGPLTIHQLMFGTRRLRFPGYAEGIAAGQAGSPVKKRVFVLGDNLWKADDSRRFGPIDPASILGKVVRL